MPISCNSTGIVFVSALAAITGMTGASGCAATRCVQPAATSPNSKEETSTYCIAIARGYVSTSLFAAFALLYSISHSLNLKAFKSTLMGRFPMPCRSSFALTFLPATGLLRKRFDGPNEV